MKLTKEQWVSKVKTFVPHGFFESSGNGEALLYGIAEVLATLQTDIEAEVANTFILQASEEALSQHGEERVTTRLSGESLAQYAIRVQSLRNTSNFPSIKSLVDSLLIVGQCSIVEDEIDGGVWADRESHVNRGYLLIDLIWNTFSIIVEKQVHVPYSFCDREDFSDREDFVGIVESPQELFDVIVEAVNKAKAFGTAYRVVERL